MPLVVIGFLVALAALGRTTILMFPSHFNDILLGASLLWILALLIWEAVFVPKIFPPSSPQ